MEIAATPPNEEMEDGEVFELSPSYREDTGAVWADQVEPEPTPQTASPDPEPEPPVLVEAEPTPPPAAPALTVAECQCLEILRLQGARLSQQEDVLNRFQLILDQTMARLDADVQRLNTKSSHTAQSISELRAARDAIIAEIGPDRIQARMRNPPPEPFFGHSDGFRSRDGERRQPHYSNREYDDGYSGQWTQSGRRGRGGGRR
jgi:hypothetical protein